MPSHYADKRREAAAERAKQQKLTRTYAPHARAMANKRRIAAAKKKAGAMIRKQHLGTEAPELKPNRVRPSK